MPEFRGKGVGRALTAFAGVLARERGCDVMQVDPLADGKDEAFWTKMGFSSCACGMWSMRFLPTPAKTTKAAKRRKAAAPTKRESKRKAVVDAEEE